MNFNTWGIPRNVQNNKLLLNVEKLDFHILKICLEYYISLQYKDVIVSISVIFQLVNWMALYNGPYISLNILLKMVRS